MEARFYAWFLEQLLDALRQLETPAVAEEAVVQAGQAADTVLAGGERIPRTSNATRRPLETTLKMQVDGRRWQLGDDPRSDLVTFAVEDDEPPVVTRPGLPWMPPQPVMLPLAKPTSVYAPAVGNLPAHAFLPAEDGFFDAGFPREDGSGFCPPLPVGVLAVEPTGVFATLSAVACERDYKPRPQHLGTDARFNMRLPIMTGIDPDGVYYRAVRAPMKTFEYMDLL